MYCQKCGNSVDEHLIYCNRCGAKLIKEDVSPQATTNAVLSNLSIAIGFTGLGGLGILVGLLAILLKNNALPQLVVIVAIAYLATLFGICFLIMQQISRLTKMSQSSMDEKSVERYSPPPPAQFGTVNTAQLEERREQPAVSVTEHTTRTLDEVLVERK
jgi:uncharacterized membrane protein YvbJ